MRHTAFTMLAACCIALAPSVTRAAPDGDCAEQWKSADGNADGVLEGREADRYLAYYRMRAQVPPQGDRISQSEFMRACREDVFIAKAPEVGASLKGEGMTEAEAKDRARAAGFSAVSSLVKNGDGVWRGSAMRDGKSTKIVVDHKGNVAALNE